MSHPTIPTDVRPCRSGKHFEHTVYMLDELTGVCEPPCEAAQFRRVCHHVREAFERRARLREREVRRRARTGGTWLSEIDFDGIEREWDERIAAERAAVEECRCVQ